MQKIANEKIYVYLVMKNLDSLMASFSDQVEAAGKRGRGEFAVGMVTRGISTSQFKGITIRGNESSLVASNSDEFQTQIFFKAFAEIHRIFTDYTIDLIEEIAVKVPMLAEYGDLSYRATRDKAFNSIGLSVLPSADVGGRSPEEVALRLNDVECTRHVIEHNNGYVDKRFLERNRRYPYKLGDRVRAGPEQIGEAIAEVETVAEDLNERAMKKYFPHFH